MKVIMKIMKIVYLMKDENKELLHQKSKNFF